MYVFNKITVNPQLPKNINRLQEIANNLWWSWNSEYLRLFSDNALKYYNQKGLMGNSW